MIRGAVLAFFVAASAFAQRTITVSGTGRVDVVPDRAQFTVGVSTRAGSVAEAVRENNEKTRRVIDALKARGVAPAEIQTTNFSLQQPWENGRRVVGQYDVQNNVTVTRKGVGAMSELLQAAVDAGANQAWSVHFFVADVSAARDKALAAAYIDAKGRAEKLAEAAGKKIGDPLMITTEQPPAPPRVGSAQAMVVAEAPPVESGSQSVSAMVVVTFELK
jgi:uncharacterized protein YggE